MVADFRSDDTQFANALATFKSKRREGGNNNIRVGNVLGFINLNQKSFLGRSLSVSSEEEGSGDWPSVKDRKFVSKSALEETRTRLRSSRNPLGKESMRSLYCLSNK